MFWLVLLTLFIGIVLILMESMLPHGISAIAGFLFIGAGIFLAYRHDPQVGLLMLGLALPAAGLSAWWAFRTGVGVMTLKPTDVSADNPESAEPAIGDLATVCQPLRPTGTVAWNQRRLPARTIIGERESPVGERVRIRGRDSVYFLVEPAGAETPPAQEQKLAD